MISSQAFTPALPLTPLQHDEYSHRAETGYRRLTLQQYNIILDILGKFY
jgi:hypothetical protein